jgi:hypothetical protein
MHPILAESLARNDKSAPRAPFRNIPDVSGGQTDRPIPKAQTDIPKSRKTGSYTGRKTESWDFPEQKRSVSR